MDRVLPPYAASGSPQKSDELPETSTADRPAPGAKRLRHQSDIPAGPTPVRPRRTEPEVLLRGRDLAQPPVFNHSDLFGLGLDQDDLETYSNEHRSPLPTSVSDAGSADDRLVGFSVEDAEMLNGLFDDFPTSTGCHSPVGLQGVFADSVSNANLAPDLNHATPSATEIRKCLLDGPGHPLLVVAPGQVTNARRAFQGALADAGVPFVYADDDAMLHDQEYGIRVENGVPRCVDGPFRQLLTTGGTLMLNLTLRDASPRFTLQQLEAFNTLMEEQLWEGKPIACKAAGQRVKVAFLADTDTPLTQVTSGALASRMTLRDDFRRCAFPEAPDPVAQAAERYHPTAALVIDLQHDAQGWQSTLFGGPEVTEQNVWREFPGALRDFKFSQQKLVLRNAPQDPRLMDQILAWQASHPERIQLEHGLPTKDAAKRLASRTSEESLESTLRTHAASVCVVTSSSIDEVLQGAYGVRDGSLTRLPAMLANAKQGAPSKSPVILVAEDLNPTAWDRLMLHPEKFSVAAAPHISVDARYAPYVQKTQPCKSTEVDSLEDLGRTSAWSSPVTFLHCADTTLVDAALPPQSTRIYVTPSTRVDELLYSLNRQCTDDNAASSVPRFETRTHQLVDDLKSGKTVLLYGLESSPELARDLASLLHPPHTLVVAGERESVSGRLIVVTPDKKLVDRHGLTPARAEPTLSRADWENAVASRLAPALSRSTEDVQTLLKPVLNWFEALQKSSVMPRQDPPAPYATLEKVCGTLSALRSARTSDPDPDAARVLRSLMKDMMIGDFRTSELMHDTQYAKLKACLKVLLPDDMSAMPEKSVDTARLEQLLSKVRHPDDIAHLAWPFLNAFSPDVIREVIGEPSKALADSAQDDIAEKVVELVCAQARQHGVALPPLVDQRPRVPSPAEVVAIHQRPLSLEREVKLARKVEQATGHGVFLKGPPGTGKTHLVDKLTQGRPVFWASVSDEGTQAFSQKIQAWATTQPPGTLVIDEANLALPGNLAMLKGVFADRTVHVEGRVHPLEKEHKILFTGNADSLPGRHKQQVAQESFATVQFKSMDRAFLNEAFVRPVIQQAAKMLSVGQSPGVAGVLQARVDGLGEQVLDIHESLRAVFPGAGLSPRDLEEFLARVLSQLKTSGPDTRKLPSSGTLARTALEVYGSNLPADALPVVRTWLRHELSEKALSESGELYDAPAIRKALQAQQLAPTESTVALAGAVDSWLTSQAGREEFNSKATTFGKRAMLIEGPASRGKDSVVRAVLQARNLREGDGFVHLNANPQDLDGLRAAVSSARERGQVVVVSELNLLPSGILESELNTLLTGQTGQAPAPGFALIATINPGYAGRQTLSAALQNRMQVQKVGDYSPSELLPIALAHAASLNSRSSSPTSAAHPSPPAEPLVSDQKVQALVHRHQELLGQLVGHSAEFMPGIRQLRDTLALLAKRPSMTVDEAYNTQYGFYRDLAAKPPPMTPRPSHATHADELSRQLHTALALARPGMVQPQWRSDRTLSVNAPVVYDATRHEVCFNPDVALERLTDHMLNENRAGRLFVGQIAVTPTESIAAASETPPPIAADDFNPLATHKSGVGAPDEAGHIGSLQNFGPQHGHLIAKRETVAGTVLRSSQRTEPNAGVLLPRDAPKITLNDITTSKVGVVYLPVPANHRPAAVQFDGTQPDSVNRDRHGGWYVMTDLRSSPINSLSYSLVEDLTGADMTPVTLPPEFPNLARAYNPEFADEVSALSARRAELSDLDLAHELEDIFKSTFAYSRDDAEALNRTNSLGARCERFLGVGEGVCYEFATTYAAVLVQQFNIPARICHGNTANDQTGQILRQGHTWAEVRDPQGRWHTIDPTGSPASQSNRGDAINYRFESQLIEHEVLEAISLDALGLTRPAMQRGGAQFHPTTGVLDVKRAVAGNTDMFRRGALMNTTEPRPLVITDFRPVLQFAGQREFLQIMELPFIALHKKGVPIFVPGPDGTLTRATDTNALRAVGEGSVRPDGPLPDGALLLDSTTAPMLERLATMYWEARMKAFNHNLDVSDKLALTRELLLEHVSFDVESIQNPHPVTVFGHRIAFSPIELDAVLSSAQKALRRAEQLLPTCEDADQSVRDEIDKVLCEALEVTQIDCFKGMDGFDGLWDRVESAIEAFTDAVADSDDEDSDDESESSYGYEVLARYAELDSHDPR